MGLLNILERKTAISQAANEARQDYAVVQKHVKKATQKIENESKQYLLTEVIKIKSQLGFGSYQNNYSGMISGEKYPGLRI